MSKRAQRRHDSERMKQKARRVAKVHGWPENVIVKNADHLASCSCDMCGNPRRHEKKGLTIQERRALAGGKGEGA